MPRSLAPPSPVLHDDLFTVLLDDATASSASDGFDLVAQSSPGVGRDFWAYALLILVLLIVASACRTPADRIRDPAEDLNTDYIAGPDGKQHELVGKASWYGDKFHGRTTASGEPYDKYAFTAAHKTLPFHTIVRVHDPATRKSVVVRITDRGPFGNKGRIIDLSWAAAHDLEMEQRGVIPIRIEVLQWGDGTYVRE